jgi:hypothetical protein
LPLTAFTLVDLSSFQPTDDKHAITCLRHPNGAGFFVRSVRSPGS